MNTNRLLELTELLIEADNALGMQAALDALRTVLDGLVSNPADQGAQRQVHDAIAMLAGKIATFEAGLTPAQVEAIKSIGGEPYFLQSLPAGIHAHMATGGITPTVVRDRVSELQSQRADYLRRLLEVRTGMRALGVAGLPMEPGVEVGFLLPRPMFQNTLDGLGREFQNLTKIIDVFSELATGSKDPVELRQLSTSNPEAFVAMAVPTAIVIGKTIDWLLAKTREIIEQRKLWQDTKNAGMPQSALDIMKEHITNTINAQIEEKSKELVAASMVQDQGRRNELENATTSAIRQLFGRVEKGMTVEIKLLPPTAAEGETPEKLQERNDQYGQLRELSKRMEFPALTGEALLSLEPPPPLDENPAAE